jgi:AraC-like DNA-binding protein
MPGSRVLKFTDPLECQAAIKSADVEILPTTRQNFKVEIIQVDTNRLWIQNVHAYSPAVCTIAYKRNRRSIGFLSESNSSSYQHCGQEVSRGDIIVNGFDVVHRRSNRGLDYGSMSLPMQVLDSAAEAITGREFGNKLDQQVIHPHPRLTSRLLKLHGTVAQLARDIPDLLVLPQVLRAFENEFLHMMVRCLADGAEMKEAMGTRRHIMARFEEFLAANCDRPLYLTEICAAIGVAERTLRASCEEHLGMGPIRFLTLRRMHLARRALLCADPTKATVTRIVTDHGFWELGRFSVAYRALFGESPSETLRSAADQIAINLNRPSSLPAAGLSGPMN